jgi:hypothetical protein
MESPVRSAFYVAGTSRQGMVSWITEMIHNAGRDATVVALVFATTLVTSFAIEVTVLVRLPPDYLSAFRG